MRRGRLGTVPPLPNMPIAEHAHATGARVRFAAHRATGRRRWAALAAWLAWRASAARPGGRPGPAGSRRRPPSWRPAGGTPPQRAARGRACVAGRPGPRPPAAAAPPRRHGFCCAGTADEAGEHGREGGRGRRVSGARRAAVHGGAASRAPHAPRAHPEQPHAAHRSLTQQPPSPLNNRLACAKSRSACRPAGSVAAMRRTARSPGASPASMWVQTKPRSAR